MPWDTNVPHANHEVVWLEAIALQVIIFLFRAFLQAWNAVTLTIMPVFVHEISALPGNLQSGLHTRNNICSEIRHVWWPLKSIHCYPVVWN
jgi:hypothetical protein